MKSKKNYLIFKALSLLIGAPIGYALLKMDKHSTLKYFGAIVFLVVYIYVRELIKERYFPDSTTEDSTLRKLEDVKLSKSDTSRGSDE